MNEYYKSCECGDSESLDLDDSEDYVAFEQPENFKEILDAALLEIYGNPDALNAALYALTYEALSKAIDLSFVSETSLKASLKANAALFSAHKTEKQVKDLASFVFDENGRKIDFGKFKKLASTTLEEYNSTWLRVERNVTVRAARMASQWTAAQESAGVYPNIEYIRSRAAEPRIKHLKLVGVIRPITDPFWRTYLPPNDWGCLCGFRVTDKEVTDLPEEMPFVPLAFRNNVGITGEIFAKDHPYFQQVGDKENGVIQEFLNKQ
jgi:Phage Mu protein F like protein